MSSPPSTAASVSNEQLKLLGQLAQDVALPAGDKILKKCPEWYRIEKAKLIPPGSSQILLNGHSLSLADKSALFATDPDYVRALFLALRIEGDIHAVQYVLTTIFQIIRDDTSRYDSFVDGIRDEDVFNVFISVLERKPDSYTADKAAFLFSGVISRGKKGMFTKDQIVYFIQKLIKGSSSLTDAGRLEGLANILKLDDCRDLCWNTSQFGDIVSKALGTKGRVPELYSAIFCVWLLTFNPKFLESLVDAGIMLDVCRVLKECKTEKVIRLATRVLVNSLKNERAVELIIEQNSVQVLTLLEYEKWRDDETYHEIQEGLASLQGKIRQFSNFDRYRNELLTGRLKWSFLHSEKFWHENVMHFEENEFEAVKQLVSILKNANSTPLTLAVACCDIGEFARLHPTGKRMLNKMQVKALVMMYMSHQDRDVCREALLCTQKLMLDRWQAAAGEPDASLRHH